MAYFRHSSFFSLPLRHLHTLIFPQSVCGLLCNGQDWTRRISQGCFHGVVPKNTLRFGRFRRVLQTQQVAGLGTNSLEYEGSYPNHPRESKWSKGQRSQDPDAGPLRHPGESGQMCFIPRHTAGSSCDLTGDTLPTRESP